MITLNIIQEKFKLNDIIKFVVDGDGKFIITLPECQMQIISNPSRTSICKIVAIYQNGFALLENSKKSNDEAYVILFSDIKKIVGGGE